MEEFRDQLIASLRTELFGPADGAEEVVAGRPAWRYLCGMLFPSELDAVALSEEDEADDQVTQDESVDASVALAYEALPSSMGVSFFVTGASTIQVAVEAACYEPEKITPVATESEQPRKKVTRGATSWRRRPIAEPTSPDCVRLVVPKNVSRSQVVSTTVLGNRGRVEALFRPRGDGFLVTVTLVNTRKAKSAKSADQVEAMLFQCRFTVDLDEGVIGEYPTSKRHVPHPEDEELALIYRNRRTHGIGHGCAASWDPDEARALRRIAAEPLPSFSLTPLTTDISLTGHAAKAMSVQWLGDSNISRTTLDRVLTAFADCYESWINEQEHIADTFGAQEAGVAGRLVGRQRRALDRIRQGILALVGSEDERVLEAFRIAQRVMLVQFAWSQRSNTPVDLGSGAVHRIEFDAPQFKSSPRWRPFQLAFQLLVLESLVNDSSADRDALDLLWFPTGGGKTEAYLALIAFEIVLRRLRYGGAGAGTAVMMRYTLRLLTSQQFERASRMISALEWIRRTQPELGLGDQPIRLGLWVGGETTPNRLDSDSDRTPGALQLYEQLLEQERPENPFQLRACPACGTRLVPQQKSGRVEDYGFRVDRTGFYVNCPDPRCVLHTGIPVSIVDDDLLRRPPSFLIGTIDKFARMVWDARFRVFLGRGPHAEGVLPPKLIVQDELHLITGPLGTIAGTYEAAIDTVLRQGGVVPKYVAATATIQRAEEQCRALYARDAFVFPPSGLNAEDAFFSREDATEGKRKSHGRTYVGAMGHGMYSGLTSLVQASSAAAHAANSLPDSPPIVRDTYWTQVIYHNSRQELGKTTTMLMDDVRSRLELIESASDIKRDFRTVEELSANVRGARLTEALEALNVPWPNDDVIDAVASTNIVSVGVDIARLGLMIVKSQPKATAEYIQASSRVGRDPKRPPGVVIALYAANRPRDRSHYESFQSYHQSLYRTVEPTSVTPFSPPARERTLHAALVLALRHLLGWEEAEDVQRFDPNDPDVRSVVSALKDRIRRACRDDEWAEIDVHIDGLLEEWRAAKASEGSKLRFSTGGRTHYNLLGPFPVGPGSASEALWPTLNSMRHVDGEVRFGPLSGSDQ
jgi:hypothetical protein